MHKHSSLGTNNVGAYLIGACSAEGCTLMPVLHMQLALHPASSLIAPMQGHLICVLHMHMHILCTSWLPRRREQTRKETGHHESLLQNTPKQNLGRRQVDDSPDWG